LESDKALFALTLAWTGARVSEVLALTPAAFQIDAALISITTLKRRRHAVREIPVPDWLMEALNIHFKLQAQQTDAVTSGRRLWSWHRVTAWRLIRGITGQLNIAGARASPRGLRHGFGIAALQSGVPLNILQRWLGHARISTTSIYADAVGPEERALAERFWRSNNR
jgi:integrase